MSDVPYLRYPPAANAWRGGIQKYDVARSQLPAATIAMDRNYHIQIALRPGADTNWFILPYVVNSSGIRVVYYLASYGSSSSAEYVIAPDKLDEFSRDIEKYSAVPRLQRSKDAKQDAHVPPAINVTDSKLSGLRYPTSPNQWTGGIVMYPIAHGSLPKNGTYLGPTKYFLPFYYEFGGDKLIYVIIPTLVGRPMAQVIYYVAYNPIRNRTEYAITPGMLDEFVDNVERYHHATRFGWPEKEQEVQGATMVHSVMKGEIGEAFRSMGRSWKGAIQDLEWWLFSFGIPTTMWYAGLVNSAAQKVSHAGARTVLSEQEAVLAVIKDGKILAQSANSSLSHDVFVFRSLGTRNLSGPLQGAEVVTIGSYEGQIIVLRSRTFHGSEMPASASAHEAARRIYQAMTRTSAGASANLKPLVPTAIQNYMQRQGTGSSKQAKP